LTYTDFWRSLTAVYEEGEAQAVARMVLEMLFGLTMADVLVGRMPDEAELLPIQQRLLTGEPVQYVIGQAEFCEQLFHVEPGVLIPRPETQWMCDFVSSSWGFLPREGSILDIGTGSGCIACTVAYDLSGSPVEVVGWDISDTALRVARENARRLGVKVKFVKQDALCPPDDHECWDIIVSNPPYVCEQEKADMARNVLDFEPAEALFVPDNDPQLFYRSIGHYALQALKPEGFLLVEVNARYSEETANLFLAMGFVNASLFTDQFQKDRFVLASKICIN
jgi:release factor glutamine methyltransferase